MPKSLNREKKKKEVSIEVVESVSSETDSSSLRVDFMNPHHSLAPSGIFTLSPFRLCPPFEWPLTINTAAQQRATLLAVISFHPTFAPPAE